MKNLELQLIYMMKNYLSNLHQKKIARSVSYDYHHLKRDGDICLVVGKLFAADAVMHLYMITKAMKLIIREVSFL